MFGDQVVRTAADLVRAARCEFALLRALDTELGLLAPDPPGGKELSAGSAALSPNDTALSPDSAAPSSSESRTGGDVFGTRTARVAYEAGPTTSPAEIENTRARLRAPAGDRIVSVRSVAAEMDSASRIAGLEAAHAETVAALRSGAPVIEGATFFDGSFTCACDFLIRDDEGRYTAHGFVGERRDAVATALELAACAAAVERCGAPIADTVRVHRGDKVSDRPLTALMSVYLARTRRLDRIIEDKLGELLPVQWGDPRFLACAHCPTCTAALTAARDPLLVAGLDDPARTRLREAGITTIDRLARTESAVPGLAPRTVIALRRQAEIQLRAEESATPVHTVLDPGALGALPHPHQGDLALTLRRAPDGHQRLTIAAPGISLGTVVLANESPTSRRAFTDLLDRLVAHRRAHPDAHVYYYGSAVRDDLLTWTGRHGAGEEIIDESLCDGVLVDLYPILRGALVLGVRSYELPALREILISANTSRSAPPEAEVRPQPDAHASDHTSSTEKHSYREQYSDSTRAVEGRRDPDDVHHSYPEHDTDNAGHSETDRREGRHTENAQHTGSHSYPAQHLMSARPGASDCAAVLRLRDWLLDRADEHGVVPAGGLAPFPSEHFGGAPVSRPSSVEAALAEFAGAASDVATPYGATSEVLRPGGGIVGAHPAALMAAALGYHRRERKPLWWAHADRLTYPVDEWVEAPGVLVAEWGSVDTKWHHSPNRPTMRRYLTLTGRIGGGRAGGATLAPGTTVYTFYEQSADSVGRRATATATVLGCAVDADFADTVRLEELLPEGREPFDELPTAIAPGLPRSDADAESAVEFAAQQLLVALPGIPDAAIFDILARRPPRLRDGRSLPRVFGDHAAAITSAVEALDDSYVAVQGPPGTGKTATAARVIERLVARDKWRIGVVALSHPTIENILDAIVEIGVLPELVAKKDVGAVAPEWAVIDADRYPRFLDNAVNGCVIGGAPADFANEELIPRGSLDLLVIADAGYFPLAELIAVAACARNLLLFGDPATTALRATHPEPVGASALDMLIGGDGTLSTERGYFLDRTWRTHPSICEPLSRLRYGNRLHANETVTLARRLDQVAPGIETVLVDHHGNTTESEAEAREVVRRIRTLLGATWTVGTHSRRLHPHDIFVVAPYGAQVARIRTLLARAKIEDVLVGTPDRFRGREAAVVLVSTATSTPAEAPYGMSALLAGDLLRAAVCRALWKTVIIRSTLLTEYLPATEAGVAELAAFLDLTT
ncbi:bifunctional RecB family nuclease/DEAD/DEAH box helicase [Nocardia bovistercoris]